VQAAQRARALRRQRRELELELERRPSPGRIRMPGLPQLRQALEPTVRQRQPPEESPVQAL
jgi:hypothetical protein